MELGLYNNIKGLVSEGATIENTCYQLKIDRSTLYKELSPFQKSELSSINKTHAKFNKSAVCKFNVIIGDELF
jgi:hypothetical protein